MSAEIIQHPSVQRVKPSRRATFPLHRRHVFYVPGYDGRGVRSYRRLFREGCESLETVYGVETTVGKVSRRSDSGSYVWPATAETPDWRVETTYEFLQWDDLVRADLARSPFWKLARGLKAYWHYVWSGAAGRIIADTWQFAAFSAYPLVMLLVFALSGLTTGTLLGYAASLAGAEPEFAIPFSALIGLVTSAVLFSRLGRRLYVDYLFVDTIATLDYARHRRPDWDERLDRFAERIVEAAAREGIDEVLIVGHSSGTFLAIDLADRAMRLEPTLGRIGPRLSLLTLGSVTPIVSYLPEAEWFREALARLAVSDRLTWLEYQARKDVMSVYRSDPVAGSGIKVPEDERVNPTVVPVQLRSLVTPGTYRALQGSFFKIHFLFISGAERPCHFDYHMIVLGPVPLALRARYGNDAFAALLPDRQAEAWGRLTRTSHEV